jgi:hypothetical protein
MEESEDVMPGSGLAESLQNLTDAASSTSI